MTRPREPDLEGRVLWRGPRLPDPGDGSVTRERQVRRPRHVLGRMAIRPAEIEVVDAAVSSDIADEDLGLRVRAAFIARDPGDQRARDPRDPQAEVVDFVAALTQAAHRSRRLPASEVV